MCQTDAGSCQSVDVSVVYTQDLTTNPTIHARSSGGADVGGYAGVHVRFTKPAGQFSPPSITEIRIHEAAGHLPDYLPLTSPVSFNGMTFPDCGDPIPPNPNVLYHYESWPSWTYHNGPHTVSVTVKYMTGYVPNQVVHIVTDRRL